MQQFTMNVNQDLKTNKKFRDVVKIQMTLIKPSRAVISVEWTFILKSPVRLIKQNHMQTTTGIQWYTWICRIAYEPICRVQNLVTIQYQCDRDMYKANGIQICIMKFQNHNNLYEYARWFIIVARSTVVHSHKPAWRESINKYWSGRISSATASSRTKTTVIS